MDGEDLVNYCGLLRKHKLYWTNLWNNSDLLIVLKLGSSPRMIIHAYSQLSKYIGDADFG